MGSPPDNSPNVIGLTGGREVAGKMSDFALPVSSAIILVTKRPQLRP
jgi:hypothetical protein